MKNSLPQKILLGWYLIHHWNENFWLRAILCVAHVAPTTATNEAAADLAWIGLPKPVTAVSGTRWREPVHVSRSHCHRKVQKTCKMTMTDFKKLNTLSPLRCTPKSFRGRVAIPRKSISTFVHFLYIFLYICTCTYICLKIAMYIIHCTWFWKFDLGIYTGHLC